jgi:hypothetical protein
MVSEQLLRESPPFSSRPSLYRFSDGSRFAYAHRQEFIRCRDNTLWAHVRDDRLFSARSGDCLAIRVGNIYYEPESREPLFYELA